MPEAQTEYILWQLSGTRLLHATTLPPLKFCTVLCRLQRIIAAASGLDAWTDVDSPGIQQLAFVPTSGGSARADLAVTWLPLPPDTQQPYEQPPSQLQVCHCCHMTSSLSLYRHMVLCL